MYKKRTIRNLSFFVAMAIAAFPVFAAPSESNAQISNADTLHYVANEGVNFSATTALGYNLHDTNMSISVINLLPAGTQAMVWTGTDKCPLSLSTTFTNFVSAQATNPKIYGYYLVDEPHDISAACVNGIKEMADYVHTYAPGKKTFIVLDDSSIYSYFAPNHTHVDLFGIDPYPCTHNAAPCNYPKIGSKVSAAVSAGIPRTSLVPVYQLFGNSYYRPPTVTELRTLLLEWQKEVPNPVFDYSYSWDCQNGSLTDCMVTHPQWQYLMKAYFMSSTATIKLMLPMILSTVN